ncbi:MAG: hypothetical protein IKC31_04160 [Clostridia bacterium]|nr:hypothetical protein [Clostridia bacterium]
MKTRALKTVLCLALSLATLLCAVACAGVEEGVPEGMKNATVAGSLFRLYVPNVWTLNTAYGISGAYYRFDTTSTVSAVRYPITDALRAEMEAAIAEETAEQADAAGKRLEWYFRTQCLAPIQAQAQGGTVEEVAEDSVAIVLDKTNAKRYHYKATVNGALTHVVQVVAEKGDAFYVITAMLDDTLYQTCIPSINTVISAFRFSDEAYRPKDYAKYIDANDSPYADMRLASNDDVAYLFYVPKDESTWVVNYDERIFSVYHATDRASISVVPFNPANETMDAVAYFEECKLMMINTAGKDGFVLTKEDDTTVAGHAAKVYEYTYSVGGKTYQYRQYVLTYGNMIYSITYTATPETYGAHLGVVDSVIEKFAFR